MITVVNADTLGVSEWNLDWLDVVEDAGVVYGITADSLVSLDGDAEDGFSGEFETGHLELGGLSDVTVPRAYLEYTSGDDAILTATTHYRGAATGVAYTLPVRTSDGTDSQTMRPVHLARGPRGPWWRFKLAGADWSLRALQILVHRLSRHS